MMTTSGGVRRLPRVRMVALLVLGLALLVSLIAARSARADFGLSSPFVGTLSNYQAGAHSDATTSFTLNTLPGDLPDGNLKDVKVDLPAGLVGNPQAIPQCPMSDLAIYGILPFASSPECPRDTMVGTVTLRFQPIPSILLNPVTLPVYNVAPQHGQPAAFAFNAIGFAIVRLDARVRSGSDAGLTINISDITQQAPVIATSLTLWGVPADHNGPGPRTFDLANFVNGGISYDGPNTNVPRQPFLTNPVQCGVQDAPAITIDSWQNPDVKVGPTKADLQEVTGCDKLSFDPTFRFRPDTTRANSPAGADVEISVPQNDNPDGVATPELKDATVDLPAGMAISPSAADGLGACTNEQVGLDSENDPACPNSSKIGNVSIDTPLLAQPMNGSIYLAQPLSNDSQTGEMFRLFLVAQGEGVQIKLEGHITPDKDTGQLRAVFLDNPQLPFSSLRLHFDGGPRAALSTPTQCGTYTSTAALTSWAPGVPVATPSDSFTIDQDAAGNPCGAAPFSPGFVAGVDNAAAGGSSTFQLRFSRNDTDQTLRAITVDMPEGLTGLISAATLCAEPAASAGTCGPESQIGTTTVAAGPGSNPYYLTGAQAGKVYLTGGYNGGAFGLSIVVPAVAGPFNLGTVVVRAGIFVDNTTTKLRIVSDPLPTMLQGVPLGIRLVNVSIDKPGFMLTPTNCSPSQVAGAISSNGGATANVSSRFQVGSCGQLPFKPKMTLRVGSRGHTKAGVTTPLTVTLAMTRGQANNRVVDVDLPNTLNAQLDVVNVRNACSPEQYGADRCPQQVGTATANTPLLRDPLLGRVFLVRNPARRLPDLMVRLRGQGEASLVDIDLLGKITIPKDLSLRTRFDTVPDVPITRFTLNLVSGRNAPVGTVKNLCMKSTRKARATLAFTAQNGKKVTSKQKLTIAGCTRTVPEKSEAKAQEKAVAQSGQEGVVEKSGEKGRETLISG
jgi:hypothetical protein